MKTDDAQALPGPQGRPTLLAVDDTPANLALLSQLLGRQYRVQVAVNGHRALELAQRSPPDLVLLDIMMPELDGFEVCRRLKDDPRTAEVPVIFLTALSGAEDETRGFAAGGADFVAKPFTPATLMARVRSQLELKAWRDALRDRNAWLQRELDARMVEVDRLHDTTLFVMVSLAEFRDTDTANHLRRMQEYLRVLARRLVEMGVESDALGAHEIDAMAKAAPLHDIGKVAIPDGVLLKPGPLTPEEWTVMRTHTTQGSELLRRAADHMGERPGSLLHYGMQIARHHHEKWDGSGYPDGLSGTAIPLAARLLAVADVYDALISHRPYKGPMTHAQAVQWIADQSGAHFDPRIVQALQDVQAQMIDIARTWRDNP